MPRFQGIVQRVVLNHEDLEQLLAMPAEEIDQWSPVKVAILPDTKTLYESFARSIADVIKRNNERREETKLILPVGPTPQYPILAEITNREKISWRNVWTFNMDEYLDWQGRAVPENHPMSFRGYMRRNLFDLIDQNFPSDHAWFPDPSDPDAIDDKIEELGGIDVAYGGIGYHGHIAFNEPVDTYFVRLTPEEFKRSRTRVVPLNPDTFVINSLCGIGGNPYGLPPMAVTIGMKPILGAKRIELYCDGGDLNWQLASFRIACMHPPTLDRPVTFVQEHPNPKETVTISADARTAAPVTVAPK